MTQLFALSRDYEKAFELIKGGQELVCTLDYDGSKEDVRIAVCDIAEEFPCVNLIRERNNPFDKAQFFDICKQRSVEFFIPVESDRHG